MSGLEPWTYDFFRRGKRLDGSILGGDRLVDYFLEQRSSLSPDGTDGKRGRLGRRVLRLRFGHIRLETASLRLH